MRNPHTFWLAPCFLLALAGYLFRLAVMPLTGQHDVMFMPWMTHYINLGNFNIYAYLYKTFGERVMHKPAVWAPYPYGFYAYTSLWMEMLKMLGLVNLSSWDSIWEVAFPARLVFLFKAAYIPFDLVIAYVLYRTTGGLGLALWAWSPAALYSPFMMGQNDIYATAFAVAGVGAAAKSLRLNLQDKDQAHLMPDRWAVLCSILLGLGASFKVFPLLLLPPLALLVTPNWRSRILLVAIGCLIFIIAALPFVTTPTFVQGVLFNVEGTNAVGGATRLNMSLPPFLITYLLFLCAIAAAGSRPKAPQVAWSISFVLLASLFLLAPTPFYWLIWLTPFSIAIIPQHRRLLWAWLALQLAFVFALFVQHRELGVALPIHLSSAFSQPSLPEILALLNPLLAQPFTEAMLFLSRLLLGVSLAIVVVAVRKESKQPFTNQALLALVLTPIFIMLVGFGMNMALANRLVSQSAVGWDAFNQLIGVNVMGDNMLLTTMALIMLAFGLFFTALFRQHPTSAP
jgi:hypothetical protein